MILHVTNTRLIDPDRNPTREEMRQGGMAAAAPVLIAVFTIVIVWIA
jgi:hypothetical protein